MNWRIWTCLFIKNNLIYSWQVMLYKYIDQVPCVSSTQIGIILRISQRSKGKNKSITTSQLYKYGILCWSTGWKTKSFFRQKPTSGAQAAELTWNVFPFTDNVSGWTLTIEKYRGSVNEDFRKMTVVPQLNDRKGIECLVSQRQHQFSVGLGTEHAHKE